jgi:integrase
MALFKVNTGLREEEVVNLRWDWEHKSGDITRRTNQRKTAHVSV